MLDENLPILKSENVAIYTPAAIVSIIQNIYVAPEQKTLITLRGVYNKKGTKEYTGGIWYDELKDESSDKSITLKVPSRIRSTVTDKKTLEIICYITTSPKSNGTIEIHANVTDVVMQTQGKYTEEQLKAIEIEQQKSTLGFRDVDSHLKKLIFENRKAVIKILYGETAIIDEDIKDQMSEAVAMYDISFIKTNLSSPSEIISSLKSLNNANVDVIVIARGGGQGVDTLEKVDIAEFCLTLQPFFITAIAHKVNVPLLEKVADKRFITPTAFGQYLKDLHNSTVEEFTKSKTRLVNDITRQLEANYGKQILNLNEQLTAEKELKVKTIRDKEAVYTTEITGLKGQITSLQSQFTLQLQEKEKLLAEKEKHLNIRIETLSREKEDKDKLLFQAKGISDQYKASMDSLRKEVSNIQSGKTKLILIVVIIATIVGILIGHVLKL